VHDCKHQITFIFGQEKKGKTSSQCITVAKMVINIWEKSSIPCISSFTSIARRIDLLYGKGRAIEKTPLPRRSGSSFKSTMEAYTNSLLQLFDISKCKCTDLKTCCCLPHDRIPVQEHDFYNDQKRERKMFIGGPDKKYNQRYSKSCEKVKCQSFHPDSESVRNLCVATSSEPCVSSSFSTLARECDRFKVSDRVAVNLANAVLRDVGLLTSTDKDTLNRTTFRRQRSKSRNAIDFEVQEIQFLFF